MLNMLLHAGKKCCVQCMTWEYYSPSNLHADGHAVLFASKRQVTELWQPFNAVQSTLSKSAEENV